MSEPDLLPAPEIPIQAAADPKWLREYKAFLGLLPALLSTHRRQYVAVHDGQVVASGDEQIEVALRAYRTHGYVPIYVGLVSDEPPRLVRVPSPRRVSRTAG